MTTFGKTTIGALVTSRTGNFLDGNSYTGPGDLGTLTKFTAYLDSASPNAASAWRVALYDDSSGPHNLIVCSNEVILASGAAPAWVDFTVASTDLSFYQGATLWLLFWYGDNNGHTYSDNVASSERYKAVTYSSTGTPPTPESGFSTSASSYSLYATYTPGGAPVQNGLLLLGVG